ncbi:hypothetical protein N9I68_01560 [Bacteroidia bacterium]|nr:hypothetical protein [Bacteroidia bacterium]MDB4107777.1 hypothetical protein [Bacteroidia bacterium]
MNSLIILILLCFTTFESNAQIDSIEAKNDSITVAMAAKYPGGDDALQRNIAEHTTYPPEALENDIAGIVNLSFIIDTTGRITNLICVSVEYSPNIANPRVKKQQKQRDILIAELEKEGNDYGLIREAKNALNGVSRWLPASENGKKYL